jgi:hypothetical protein
MYLDRLRLLNFFIFFNYQNLSRSVLEAGVLSFFMLLGVDAAIHVDALAGDG